MGNEVRVLSTFALKGAIDRLAGQYQTTTQTRIAADFAPTLALLKRLREGEITDVVILTREGLDELRAAGIVVAASCVDLARSYVGLAVKAGHPHPDIATEVSLRKALLNARSVAYGRIGASGIFFAKLIERMGIAAEINAKATVTSGLTAERLITGEADLAVQQISELKTGRRHRGRRPDPTLLADAGSLFRRAHGGVGSDRAGRAAAEVPGFAGSGAGGA